MTSLAPAGFSPRRGAAASAVSSPWTQIFRGDSDGRLASPSAAAVASSVIEQLVVSGSAKAPAEEAPGETSDNGNACAGKRLAWNKPSIEVAAVVAEAEPVMGADSWPALSESTKAPSKFPTESFKPSIVSPATSPVTQGTTSSLHSQKQANPPNKVPTRQRSMKRNGGGNTSTNGGFSQPPASPSPLADMPPANHSPRVTAQRSGFGSHSHDGINHQQRNSFRNRNGGPHPRGDGSHHHNYGGRRDQDRGNQYLNPHQHFSGKDAHIHQNRVGPRYITPPAPLSSGAFMTPSSMQHFGGPIGFPEHATQMYFVTTPPPDSLRGGVPFLSPLPPHAVFFHAPDLQLHGKIVNQINYYFSTENLIKDIYLRQNMDEQGWVPIKLLAGFKQVKLLTENIQFIADAVRASTVVEVQGDKVRRCNDWIRWIMPPTIQFSNRTNPQPTGDMPATCIQGLNLEEKAYNNTSAGGQAHSSAYPLSGISNSGEVHSQSSPSNSGGTGEDSVPSRN